MTESNTLIVADNYLVPARWDQMEKLATALVQSKALPRDIQNAPQALVKMQAGIEMGLMPMQSLSGLTIINGAVTPWGKTVTFLIRQRGWKISYKEGKDEGGWCEATVEKGDESYMERFIFEDAVLSKWVYQLRKDRDGNYVKDSNGKYVQDLKAGWYLGANRKMKLRYGALSMIIKSYIPEVLGGAADIAEVAEDYVIDEITPAPTDKPKTEEVIESTPEERKTKLADFLENEKNKPKTAAQVKNPQKTVEKDTKVAKTTSNPDKKGVVVAEEGQIIEADDPATGATDVTKGVK